MELDNASLDDIMVNIISRYKYKGGLAGMSVIITDQNILISDNATKDAIMELAQKLGTLAMAIRSNNENDFLNCKSSSTMTACWRTISS